MATTNFTGDEQNKTTVYHKFYCILCGLSLGTMTAISVDRLLALYRQVKTSKRTYVNVITLWVLAAVSTATWFWNPQITLWYES